MSDEGNRQNPRFAVDASITVTGPEGEVSGRCLNVSSGGLCAELPESLVVGQVCSLALSLVFDEETSSEPLTLRGRSVWCTAMTDGNQVGFQFLSLSADETSYLAMFLRFLEEGREARKPPPTPESDIFS